MALPLSSTISPALWLAVSIVWVFLWKDRVFTWKYSLITFGIGLLATLPVHAFTLHFLTVDAASIGNDLFGRYPEYSVNYGGFKVSYIILRPLVELLQLFGLETKESILQIIKSVHLLISVGLAGLGLRMVLSSVNVSIYTRQALCGIGFLVPCLFFSAKILNYDSMSNGLALVAMICCWNAIERHSVRWAYAGLALASCAYAEKSTAFLFLLVSVGVVGWVCSTGTPGKTIRIVGTVWGIILLPSVLVFSVLLMFVPGISIPVAADDVFSSVLVGFYPLLQLPGAGVVLEQWWVQLIVIFAATVFLIFFSRWQILPRVFKGFGGHVRLILMLVVLLGLLSPYLISPNFIHAHNLPVGIQATPPANDMVISYESENRIKHFFSYALHNLWLMVEWWPTVAILFGISVFFLKRLRLPGISIWMLGLGIIYTVLYIGVQAPPGHRYIGVAGNFFVFGLLVVAAHQLKSVAVRSRVVVLLTCSLLVGIELCRYWPCVGAFRPMVMRYTVSDPPVYGDAAAPWLGWGEESALATAILDKQLEDSGLQFFAGYGDVLVDSGFKFHGCPENGQFMDGAEFDDLLIVSRSQRIRGLTSPPLGVSSILEIGWDGWVSAWVYRVGEYYPDRFVTKELAVDTEK